MAAEHRLHVIRKIFHRHQVLQQQTVAAARDDQAKLVADRTRLAENRDLLLNDHRILNERDGLDIDKVLNLRRHAEQIALEMDRLDAAVMEAAARVDACLAQLVKARQSVRATERLAERRIANKTLAEIKSAVQEVDDVTTSRHG